MRSSAFYQQTLSPLFLQRSDTLYAPEGPWRHCSAFRNDQKRVVEEDNGPSPTPPSCGASPQPFPRTPGSRTRLSNSRPGWVSRHHPSLWEGSPASEEPARHSAENGTESRGCCCPQHFATKTRVGFPLAAQAPHTPGPSSSHFLDNVQQAVEVVGVAAFGQVHQQLCGQLPDLVVSVLGDVGELGDDHCVDQLLLQQAQG